MDKPTNNKKHSILMGIGIQLVTFIVWAVIAVFLLGGSRQRMVTLGKDMENWKEEWKAEHKHITQMDLEGSVATRNFITQYEKEQAKQYERLQKLEAIASHQETMELRIANLEKIIKNHDHQ